MMTPHPGEYGLLWFSVTLVRGAEANTRTFAENMSVWELTLRTITKINLPPKKNFVIILGTIYVYCFPTLVLKCNVMSNPPGEVCFKKKCLVPPKLSGI